MKILLVSQAFYPDVVAVAQHVGDLAKNLALLGHEVVVIASNRGYDDPTVHYPSKEVWCGVKVHRVPIFGFGKKGKLRRILSLFSFFVSSSVPMFTLRRWDVVVTLSSPPLISALASIVVKLRGGRLIYWIMDLNPDEAIAAGWMKSDSIFARILETCSRFSLRAASQIVVLDRFMKDRIIAKQIPEEKIYIIPPWPHDEDVRFDPVGREAVRSAMSWHEKFVVMHAGNHSPLHPLDNLLEAALQMRENPGVVFVFSGGGTQLPHVRRFAEQQNLKNVETFGYRPIKELSSLLSAADLHVVPLGEGFVGIVHPSKVYNMLAIGKPILYIGPEESHITDMRKLPGIAVITHPVSHGDVQETVTIIEALASEFHAKGEPAQIIHEDLSAFSQSRLMREMTVVVTGER